MSTSHGKKTKEKKHEPKKISDKEIIAELTEDVQRLQAEFENFKKRSDREKSDMASIGKAQVVDQLLPVIDSFDLAIKGADPSNNFVHGMILVYQNFVKSLSDAGLRPIEAAGKKLDPEYHEVLIKEPSEKPDGTVLEVLVKGYMFNNKVLRHAKVKVSEHVAQKKEEQNNDNT